MFSFSCSLRKLSFSSAIRHRCLLLKSRTKLSHWFSVWLVVTLYGANFLIYVCFFFFHLKQKYQSTCMTQLKDGWFSVLAAMLWWRLEERGVRQRFLDYLPQVQHVFWQGIDSRHERWGQFPSLDGVFWLEKQSLLMAWCEEEGAFDCETKISSLGTGDWKGHL